MTYQFRVSEIFGPTIQGEGAQIGRPTVFVRFGGCDYRCSWCDSLYAVLPEHRPTWRRMTAGDILAKVAELAPPPMLVTLSGGNPALWDMADLLDLGRELGYEFTMETQGSLVKPWFALLNHLCLSPKPPSSGMDTDWSVLNACLLAGPLNTVAKVVVFGVNDLEYAGEVRDFVRPYRVPLYLQVGNPNPGQGQAADRDRMLKDLVWLSNHAIARGWHDVRVLPQLHALMWGNQRGV